jgi:hypothetical protein
MEPSIPPIVVTATPAVRIHCGATSRADEETWKIADKSVSLRRQ